MSARPAQARDNDRLYLGARINGHVVKLVFDTGFTTSVLLREPAECLRLKITKRPSDAPPLAPGEFPLDLAEECTLSLGVLEFKNVSLSIIDIPSYVHPDFDGIIAWSNVKSIVFEIAPDGGRLRSLPRLPADMTGWNRWKLALDEPFLAFECGSSAATARIAIDTGDPGGVSLNPERWRQWRALHARNPGTLTASYSPGQGLLVFETFRAKEIEINGFRLSDVPVMQCLHPAVQHFDAVIGLFALTRLRVIIDGKGGWLYTKAVTPPWIAYPYNRLGAVFVPLDAAKGDELIAHVREGTPAHDAGIRNGDCLLRIDGRDVTKWRTDPPGSSPNSPFARPAGTEVKLTLKRGAEVFEKTVILADLLPND